MNDSQFLQAVLLAAKSGLVVSSACLLALLAFLASAVGAKVTLIFGLEHEDGTYNNAVELCFGSAKREVAPENENKKNARCPFFIKKSLK